MIQGGMHMKRYAIAALALVLGCTMLTGCRRDKAPAMTMPAGRGGAHQRDEAADIEAIFLGIRALHYSYQKKYIVH